MSDGIFSGLLHGATPGVLAVIFVVGLLLRFSSVWRFLRVLWWGRSRG